MMEIRYTLLSDGSSDRVLIPIINWLLSNQLHEVAIQYQWADLSRCPKPLIDTLDKRISLSIELYPCELLFIHRDAEKESHATRVSEIRAALTRVNSIPSDSTVCVVPVRMTEAWLLFDIVALRKAASNPNGKTQLQLPDIRTIEDNPDPKRVLHELLRQASELSPQRLKRFSVSACTHRVLELIEDFSPLRVLPAFVALESEVTDVIRKQGWKSN